MQSTLSLLDPLISLIFGQSHSNLTHFQQSTSVINYTGPRSKIHFSSSCGPTLYRNPQIFIHVFNCSPQGLVLTTYVPLSHVSFSLADREYCGFMVIKRQLSLNAVKSWPKYFSPLALLCLPFSISLILTTISLKISATLTQKQKFRLRALLEADLRKLPELWKDDPRV